MTGKNNERYEVRLWIVVNGMRLGRDLVMVTAPSASAAKRAAQSKAAKLRKRTNDVTFEAIEATLCEDQNEGY